MYVNVLKTLKVSFLSLEYRCFSVYELINIEEVKIWLIVCPYKHFLLYKCACATFLDIK